MIKACISFSASCCVKNGRTLATFLRWKKAVWVTLLIQGLKLQSESKMTSRHYQRPTRFSRWWIKMLWSMVSNAALKSKRIMIDTWFKSVGSLRSFPILTQNSGSQLKHNIIDELWKQQSKRTTVEDILHYKPSHIWCLSSKMKHTVFIWLTWAVRYKADTVGNSSLHSLHLSSLSASLVSSLIGVSALPAGWRPFSLTDLCTRL